jgi:hypothetical protein
MFSAQLRRPAILNGHTNHTGLLLDEHYAGRADSARRVISCNNILPQTHTSMLSTGYCRCGRPIVIASLLLKLRYPGYIYKITSLKLYARCGMRDVCFGQAFGISVDSSVVPHENTDCHRSLSILRSAYKWDTLDFSPLKLGESDPGAIYKSFSLSELQWLVQGDGIKVGQ